MKHILKGITKYPSPSYIQKGKVQKKRQKQTLTVNKSNEKELSNYAHLHRKIEMSC